MRVLGATWGDPWSFDTYSGVPVHLFDEWTRTMPAMIRARADLARPGDVLRGALDVHRSLEARRPRRDQLWRYRPRSIELLTERFRRVQRTVAHDVTLQFGVAGIPLGPLVAHVEIPVETAMSLPHFAASYGFDAIGDRIAAEAIEGERQFLSQCDLIWTNTSWTAAQLEAQGVERSSIVVCPPACGVEDPGAIERDWSELHLLFIGKDWERKGGPLLLDAFEVVRRCRPEATLTIIGCRPPVDRPGVHVLGFLDKGSAAHAARLRHALQRATVFVMPSYWESTGIVYLEAAMYGLPVVMLAGQGREELLPASVAVALAHPSADELAAELLHLGADPDRLRSMGRGGRALVRARHTWAHVAATLADALSRARAAQVSC